MVFPIVLSSFILFKSIFTFLNNIDGLKKLYIKAVLLLKLILIIFLDISTNIIIIKYTKVDL